MADEPVEKIGISEEASVASADVHSDMDDFYFYFFLKGGKKRRDKSFSILGSINCLHGRVESLEEERSWEFKAAQSA